MTDTASLSSERYGSSPPSYLSSPPDPILMSKDGSQLSSIPTQHRPPPLSLSIISNKFDSALPRRPQSSPVMATNSSHGAVAAVAANALLPPTPAASYDHPDETYGVPRSGKRTRSIDIEEENHTKIPRLSPYTPATTSYDQPNHSFGMSRGGKQTRPIDIEEANHHNTGKLSPYTPGTGRGEGSQELICLCAKAPKVPRPRNGMYPVSSINIAINPVSFVLPYPSETSVHLFSLSHRLLVCAYFPLLDLFCVPFAQSISSILFPDAVLS
jgi:hypothetical protein